MKLQTKLTLTILSIFSIALLLVGIFVFASSKNVLESEIENQLSSRSTVIANNIEHFLGMQFAKIEVISTQNDLSNEELEQMTKIDSSFSELTLIDSNGVVIRSSNLSKIGKTDFIPCYSSFIENKTSICPIYFDSESKKYLISFLIPFHEETLIGKTEFGIFEETIVKENSFRETGETLFVLLNKNDEIVYLHERRFSSNLPLIAPKEKFSGLPVYHVLVENDTGLHEGLKDYRGEKTISILGYIDEIKLGLVTKIDEKEAFAPVGKLKKTISLFILAMIFLVGFFVYFFSRKISKEIQDLTEEIVEITKGKLDIQLKKSSTLEIQNLTDSLNRILASMKLAILKTGLTQSELGLGEAIKAKEEAEKLLEEERNEEKLILDSVPAWIFYKDKENNFLKVNKAFAEGMKMPKEKLEGKSLWKIYPKKQADAFWKDDKEVIKSGKAKRNILEPAMSSKGMRWVRTDKIPYKDKTGKIIGIVGFSVDLTELIKEEKKKELKKK